MKKNKGFAVGMALCFVAAISLTGFWVFQKKNETVKEPKNIQKKEEKLPQEPSAPTQSTIVKKEEKEPEKEPVKIIGEDTETLSFSKASTLLWPVDGQVIINYSMDKTVYFSTLDQYKYNPAVIISAEKGSEVAVAARGIVTDVTETAETGLTITMDLGSGYEAIYGQVMEVSASPGKYMEKGEILGKLAEPTKYYSVEGSNLYFKLLKDGEPVNPMDYFEE